MELSDNPCPEVQVTEEIKKYFDARSHLGWNKYGTTMDRDDLKPHEWCSHIIDELADAMQYAWKLRHDLLMQANDVETPQSNKRTFRALSHTRTYNDLVTGECVSYADENHEMHSAVVCGFVLDPEDGKLVVIQTGYNWVAVTFDTLYEEIPF